MKCPKKVAIKGTGNIRVNAGFHNGVNDGS